MQILGASMTKKELIELLAPYDDDRYIAILLYTKNWPYRGQVIIQGVTTYEPWHGGLPDKSNWLIGIKIHEFNTEIKDD